MLVGNVKAEDFDGLRYKDGGRIVNDGYSSRHAVVCGVNIKTYDFQIIGKRDQYSIKEKWGLFLHLRLDDGSQVDAVYHLNTSLTDKSYISMPLKKLKKRKRTVNRLSTFPAVLRLLGVNELVELFGVEVEIIYKISELDREVHECGVFPYNTNYVPYIITPIAVDFNPQ